MLYTHMIYNIYILICLFIDHKQKLKKISMIFDTAIRVYGELPRPRPAGKGSLFRLLMGSKILRSSMGEDPPFIFA